MGWLRCAVRPYDGDRGMFWPSALSLLMLVTMDPAEYLPFIPLLFYGIAMADLLGQWKRFFDRSYLYLPYFLTTIMMTEVAIWNVYLYLNMLDQLKGIGYFAYWLHLVQPMLFLICVSALTPDSDTKDTKEYFDGRLTIVYGLLAAFVASHFLPAFYADSHLDLTRFAGIALCLVIAITRRPWMVYVMVVVWASGILARI